MSVDTVRELDALCLPQEKEFTVAQTNRIQMKNKFSQTVFPVYLETGKPTVQKWEQGQKSHLGLS